MILARSSRLRACGSLGWVCRKFQLGEHLKERLPPSGVIRPHARAPQLASQMDWLPATGFRFRDVSADYDADARTREAGRQAERLVPKTLAAINYRGQIWHGNPLRSVGAAGERNTLLVARPRYVPVTCAPPCRGRGSHALAGSASPLNRAEGQRRKGNHARTPPA
jgi:hypothetical protein